ncbi:mechanosensitive ion channel family protein [Azospirillum soli]|uniref:mechanosensitive ion channel family protein n=1 Tax=Azospirillum soli TaxID=1304799 RepID=UPI001AE99103|nr:mechanosensitive ion channel domain-containing protein [Azospirillum soli]MBP2316773.1 small-conductance mechanosensitive channel [Azospirillum soli]
MTARLIWPMVMVAVSLLLLVGHPWLLKVAGAPPESVVAMAPVVLGGASCFSAAWLTARLVVLILERTSRDQRRLPKLLQESVTVAFFLIALMGTIALALDGAVAGSVATSGVVIAILGFALRNIIADIVLGIALGLERSYRIGDWLKIDNGVSGVVIDINWRTTRLLTRNQTHVILPNSRIAQRQLVNYSEPKRQYRDQLRICLPHSIPVAEAKRVLLAAAQTAHRKLTGPVPDVLAVTYTLGGIEYAVRYWVPNYAEEAACRDALLTVIDAALRSEGLHVLQNTSESTGLVHQVGEVIEARQEYSSVLRQN